MSQIPLCLSINRSEEKYSLFFLLIGDNCSLYSQVVGRRCDLCEENTRSKETRLDVKVCEPCEDCYKLVTTAADAHRQNLERLDNLLREIAENPQVIK